MTIIWSKDAESELLEIVSYLKYKSGRNIARNVYARIKLKIRKISILPKVGKVVPELKELGITNIYQLTEPLWKIYYRLEHRNILVLSVIDSRRNLDEILYKKLLEGKI